MKRSFLLTVFLASCLISHFSFAEDVMDFEADVIEGEKKAPDLFLQMETETTELSPILFDRKNFNDFNGVDRKFRPRLNAPSGSPKSSKTTNEKSK